MELMSTNRPKVTANKRQSDVLMLPLKKVRPRRPDNYLRMTEKDLADLLKKIEEEGIQKPLPVEQIGPDYQIVRGGKVWRAAMLLGLKKIPCIVVQKQVLGSDRPASLSSRESKKDEKLNTALAEEALYQTRVALRSQGIDVEALTKVQNLNELADPALAQAQQLNAGGGPEQHPLLPPSEGLNQIVLPQNEEDLRNEGQRQANKNKHKHRMGMPGKGDSDMKHKQQYKQKIVNKIETPRNQPKNAPTLKPPGY